MLKCLRGKRKYDEAPGDVLPLSRRSQRRRKAGAGSPNTKGWECLTCPRLTVNRGKVCRHCLDRLEREAS